MHPQMRHPRGENESEGHDGERRGAQNAPFDRDPREMRGPPWPGYPGPMPGWEEAMRRGAHPFFGYADYEQMHAQADKR